MSNAHTSHVPSLIDHRAPRRSLRGALALAAVAPWFLAGPASAGASGVDFTFEPAGGPVLLGALGQDAVDAAEASDAPDVAVPDEGIRWTMDDGTDSDSLTIPEVLPRYGEAGSVRLDVRGGYGTDVKDSEQWIAQGGIGLSGFIEDGLALRVELNAAQIRQDEGSEQGVNLALLFEWHFLQRETWSLYIDGGAGVLFTTDDVPATGSSFNFTPQAGLGLTAEAFDDARFIFGVKWHHISNANTFDENPGRDHIMVYTGLSFPF